MFLSFHLELDKIDVSCCMSHAKQKVTDTYMSIKKEEMYQVLYNRCSLIGNIFPEVIYERKQ